MSFVDPALVHEPAAGRAVPAAWGAAVRDNLEHLVNPPAASVFNSAGQLIGSSDFGEPMGTVLDGPGVWFDSSGMHDPDDTSRINILQPGRYQVHAGVTFDAGNPSGYRVIIDLLVNGSQIVNGDTRFFAAQTTSHGVSAYRTLDLQAGDYVEVMVQHNAGTDRRVFLAELTVILAAVPL